MGRVKEFFKRIGGFFKKHIKLIIVLVIIVGVVLFQRRKVEFHMGSSCRRRFSRRISGRRRNGNITEVQKPHGYCIYRKPYSQ